MAERTRGTTQERGGHQLLTARQTCESRSEGCGCKSGHKRWAQVRWAQEKGSQTKGRKRPCNGWGHRRHSRADLGRETMGQLGEGLEDRIRNKPLQSVLIAAGVGMLLGLLWKR
jgi:hypothetical protein